ncbi:MAG: hypothetical protein WAZ77_19400 [Candidatus Nitrosopolaris sp.]
MAYKHHNYNNHNNNIKVDQQINQQNDCTGVPLDNIRTLDNTSSSTVCQHDCNSNYNHEQTISLKIRQAILHYDDRYNNGNIHSSKIS